MPRPSRKELFRLLAEAQGNMFALAANLTLETPREVIERHNCITKAVGEVLDDAERAREKGIVP
jgi:hypothetical protein